MFAPIIAKTGGKLLSLGVPRMPSNITGNASGHGSFLFIITVLIVRCSTSPLV